LTALRLAGGWKTTAALLALEGGASRLIESALPALLIGIPPVREENPRNFLRDATARFGNTGEALFLARRKANDFPNFTGIQNAKLLAYWLFPRANDPDSDDLEHKEGFRLAFRSFLDAADRAQLTPADRGTFGPRVAEPLSGPEQMRLNILGFKVLLPRQQATGLPEGEQAQLTGFIQEILDRNKWATLINGKGDGEIRKQRDTIYYQIVRTRAQELGLLRGGDPRHRYDTLIEFLRKTPPNGVIARNGDVVTGAPGQALVEKGQALTRDQAMHYLILHAQLIRNGELLGLKSDDMRRAYNQLETDLRRNPGQIIPLKKKDEVVPGGQPPGGTSVGELVGIAAKYVLGAVGVGYGIAEAVATVNHLRSGGIVPFPISRSIGKGLFYDAPKWAIQRIRSARAARAGAAPGAGDAAAPAPDAAPGADAAPAARPRGNPDRSAFNDGARREIAQRSAANPNLRAALSKNDKAAWEKLHDELNRDTVRDRFAAADAPGKTLFEAARELVLDIKNGRAEIPNHPTTGQPMTPLQYLEHVVRPNRRGGGSTVASIIMAGASLLGGEATAAPRPNDAARSPAAARVDGPVESPVVRRFWERARGIANDIPNARTTLAGNNEALVEVLEQARDEGPRADARSAEIQRIIDQAKRDGATMAQRLTEAGPAPSEAAARPPVPADTPLTHRDVAQTELRFDRSTGEARTVVTVFGRRLRAADEEALKDQRLQDRISRSLDAELRRLTRKNQATPLEGAELARFNRLQETRDSWIPSETPNRAARASFFAGEVREGRLELRFRGGRPGAGTLVGILFLAGAAAHLLVPEREAQAPPMRSRPNNRGQ
jgi:hypothetical protein